MPISRNPRIIVAIACVASLAALTSHAAELRGITAIAAGANHACAVTASGAVKCWGGNFSGQLGYGPTSFQSSAVGTLGLGTRVTAVTAGFNHTCALTVAGGVQCWGGNEGGQLGDGTTTLRVKPVDVLGLASGVVAIAAGNYYTCALTAAGGVKCWGSPYGYGGGTSNPPATLADVPGLERGVVAIAAGDDYTCALTATGAVQCWGMNHHGQLGDGTKLWRPTPAAVTGLSGGVVAIAAGTEHTCALTAAGGMQCWGSNEYGELGIGTPNLSQPLPVEVNGLGGPVKSIVVGGGQTCAVMVSGSVQCWGSNNSGESGVNAAANQPLPVDVPGLSGSAVALAAGRFDTCALLADGRVNCWGANYAGQAGNGVTSARQDTPAAVVEADRRVVEFYNTVLDNYFVTADPIEIGAVDSGSAGPGWLRTGGSFKAGGDTDVCRFYGSRSPGPNSHFYALDGVECQGLIDAQFAADDPRRLTQKSWNLENFDFSATRPAGGACPDGMVAIRRAYNNGYARGIDSNHRLTADPAAIAEVVARGWIAEGVVMCAPG